MLLRSIMGNSFNDIVHCIFRNVVGNLRRHYTLHFMTLLMMLVQINADCQFNLQQYENRRISALKMQILSKLGLSEEPSYCGPDIIPNDVMELYNATVTLLEERYRQKQNDCPTNGASEHRYFAKTPLLFNLDLTERDEPYFEGRHRYARFFKFDLSSLENHPNGADVVSEAIFRLYQEPHAMKNLTQTILFYQLIPIPMETHYLKKHIFTKTFNTKNEGPFSIDITETVQEWITNPESNHGLEAEVLCAEHQAGNEWSSLHVHFADPRGNPRGDNRGDVEMMQHSSKEFYPRLIIMTPGNKTGSSSSGHSRRRRQADGDTLGGGACVANNHPNCCLRSLYINFKRDLSWTWVRQPKGFYPNYCAGNCPFIHHDSMIYKQLISRHRQLNPDASPSPCCTPRSFKPVTVLYYDSETHLPVMSTIENAIVESCRCT